MRRRFCNQQTREDWLSAQEYVNVTRQVLRMARWGYDREMLASIQYEATIKYNAMMRSHTFPLAG